MISTYDFMVMMKRSVAIYINGYRDLNKSDAEHLNWTDVFVIWQCKTLQNIKMLLSAPGPENYLFEATYDGDKGRAYLDVYNKVDQLVFGNKEEKQ